MKDNNLKDIYPELAQEWHPTRNGLLMPEDVTIGSHKKVWWRCSNGHEWRATVYSRTRGNGCPYDAGQRAIAGINDLGTLYPEIANEWHPIRNGTLNPSDVMPGSHKRVWWICPNGHEWCAPVYSRVQGCGCPYEGNKKVMAGVNDLATTHPELTKEWHPDNNIKPAEVTSGSNRKVQWICPNGHTWLATVNSRVRGNGCPYDAGQKVIRGINDLKTINPELAKDWHPYKNGVLTPNDVMPESHKIVWWKCIRGHEWQAAIYSRNNWRGCRKCNDELQTSFPEQAIYYYLTLFGIMVSNRFKYMDKYEIDVYCHDLGVGIEYNGSYYHKDRGEKDSAKEKALKENGVRLIQVNEVKKKELKEVTVIGDVIGYPIHSEYKNLGDVLKILFKMLNLGCRNEFSIEKDRINIMNQYMNIIKDNNLKALYPEIAEQWHYTKNKDLRPEMFTPYSHHRVWWICRNGHEWESTIANRTYSRGCPICNNVTSKRKN